MNVAQTLTPIFTIATSDGVSSGAGIELVYDENGNTGTINCIEYGTGYQVLSINCNGLNVNTGSVTASNAFALASNGQLTCAGPMQDFKGLLRGGTYSGTLPTSGVGVEMYYYPSDDTCNIFAYDRGASAYKKLFLKSSLFMFSVSGTLVANVSSTAFYPQTDNTYNLGGASNRWHVIYAGTGTINTSDAREKTAIAPLTDSEIAWAKALAVEIGTFQFLDAVAAKGASLARLHIGMTVQRAIELGQSFGLDPTRYGFICHDSWDAEPEVTTEEPVLDPTTKEPTGATTTIVVQPAIAAGDRYAFRTDELLLFIARGFDARLSALEAK
ncbi:MAG: tail fiber domain-containing protein [Rhodanobacteraceae bacterium]